MRGELEKRTELELEYTNKKIMVLEFFVYLFTNQLE